MFEDCKQYLSYEGNKRNIKTWTDLSNFKGYPEEIITHKYILAFSSTYTTLLEDHRCSQIEK